MSCELMISVNRRHLCWEFAQVTQTQHHNVACSPLTATVTDRRTTRANRSAVIKGRLSTLTGMEATEIKPPGKALFSYWRLRSVFSRPPIFRQTERKNSNQTALSFQACDCSPRTAFGNQHACSSAKKLPWYHSSVFYLHLLILICK